MNKIEEKREQEKETVTEMIRFYCKKNHKSNNEELCPYFVAQSDI